MKFFVGIFKVIKWFFWPSSQYRFQEKIYRKSSKGAKITNLVLNTLFIAGSLWYECFTCDLFSKHFGWAVVSTIFCVACLYTSIKTNALYGTIAFKNIARTYVDDVVERKVAGALVEAADLGTSEQAEEIVKEEQKKTSSKKLDLASGIIYSVTAAAGFCLAILFVFLKIYGKM
ncbi:MAG: hypothetical protein IJX00_01925 [Clostridia bacterium]|nr:hypothetical protein [Clostridia bacterium]